MLCETDVVGLVQGLSRRRLRQWVQSGWVLPAQGERGASFSEIDVARARLILHLQRDMKIGPDAVPPLDATRSSCAASRPMSAFTKQQPTCCGRTNRWL